MVLPTDLLYVTDIPKITAENVDCYLEFDPLFTEYFNAFMSMEIFLNPMHFNQEFGYFEMLSKKTDVEKEDENGNDSESQESGEEQKCEPDPNSIYINVSKNSYSPIPLINVRKETNRKIKVKAPCQVYETLTKDVGLQWIKATRLSTFLRSLSYAEYRIAKLLSQAQIIEIKYPKHELIMGFRDLVYQKVKEEDSFDIERKTSLEYLMEALHISKGKTRLEDLQDWYRIQKSMISDDVSSDSMVVISKELFSESVVNKYSDTGTKEISKSEQEFIKAPWEYVPSSVTEVPIKSVIFKEVSPIIYLEPFEDLVETPCEESNASYLDSIQDLDQLAALVTVATFKSALTMLGSSAGDSIMSDLASEPCLATLSSFHYNVTLDKLNKKGTFTVQEDNVEEKNKAESKDASQVESMSSNNLEHDITPSNNVEMPVINVESPENDDETPSNNVETSVNNVEIPSNNLEDVASPNNVQTCLNQENVKPSNNEEENNNVEGITVPNNTGGCESPFNEDTYQTSSYSLEKAKAAINIHEDDSGKRTSPAVELTSSEILANFSGENKLEQEMSLQDIDPEENGSDAMSEESSGTYTMDTYQDFSNFFDFLKGTTGEKYWHLWVNIDRIKLMKTDIQKQMLIVKVNETFAKVSESSKFQKNLRAKFKNLDLLHCSEEEIKDLQALLLQPLMLYWLPHYLLVNLLKIELSKYPSYANLLNNKRKLWSSITCEEVSEGREISQTPRIYIVETEKKEAPESKLHPPHILRLPPQRKRIGVRRTHLLSSLQNCGKYRNNAINNLEKNKKEENYESSEVKMEEKPMPQVKNKLTPPVLKEFVPKINRDLPMLPEMAPVTVETVGESEIGWTQRQHPMPKVVKVDRISIGLDHFVDPWTGRLEDDVENTKIKLVNTLLDALRKESKYGNYFENFLTKCKNKLALNCLYLWHNIEKFLQIFYTQPVNMFRICRYAKFIYSKFIATGSPFSIHAGPKVMLLIWQNLDSPVGEMFDGVVEYILFILSKYWHRLLLEENWIFRKAHLYVSHAPHST